MNKSHETNQNNGKFNTKRVIAGAAALALGASIFGASASEAAPKNNHTIVHKAPKRNIPKLPNHNQAKPLQEQALEQQAIKMAKSISDAENSSIEAPYNRPPNAVLLNGIITRKINDGKIIGAEISFSVAQSLDALEQSRLEQSSGGRSALEQSRLQQSTGGAIFGSSGVPATPNISSIMNAYFLAPNGSNLKNGSETSFLDGAWIGIATNDAQGKVLISPIKFDAKTMDFKENNNVGNGPLIEVGIYLFRGLGMINGKESTDVFTPMAYDLNSTDNLLNPIMNDDGTSFAPGDYFQ